ncbi:MAG: 4Fe-4S binding protein [Chloroflexota bacterium]
MAKKLSPEEQVYEELRKTLNESFLNAPRTPSLMKILKFFYPTVEDAEVGRYVECPMVGGKAKTAAEIAGECGKDEAKVAEILNRLYRRAGAIDRKEREPGVFEYSHGGPLAMTDGLGSLGKDDTIDPSGIMFRQVSNTYHEEGFLMEMGASKYPTFRTLVVNQPIDAEAKVLPYELASEILKSHDKIGLGYCNCRVRQRKCHHRLETCFLLTEKSMKRSQVVAGARPLRYITHEEALKILEEGFKEGLVATTLNQSDPKQASFICMCCTCCCHILGGYAVNITGWGNPYQMMKSNFQPKRDEAKCTRCHICVDLCPVKALWRHWPHEPDLSDDYIFLEEERCVGCGICAFNCPNHALTMVKVRDFTPEPDVTSMIHRSRREARH